MTNNPTIYEHILSFGFRGVAFTRSYYVAHNSYKICQIKMATMQAQLHVMTKNPTKYNTFYHMVLEELLSQDLTMLHYKNIQIPELLQILSCQNGGTAGSCTCHE